MENQTPAADIAIALAMGEVLGNLITSLFGSKTAKVIEEQSYLNKEGYVSFPVSPDMAALIVQHWEGTAATATGCQWVSTDNETSLMLRLKAPSGDQ